MGIIDVNRCYHDMYTAPPPFSHHDEMLKIDIDIFFIPERKQTNNNKKS